MIDSEPIGLCMNVSSKRDIAWFIELVRSTERAGASALSASVVPKRGSMGLSGTTAQHFFA
jgi:hypothetical protein